MNITMTETHTIKAHIMTGQVTALMLYANGRKAMMQTLTHGRTCLSKRKYSMKMTEAEYISKVIAADIGAITYASELKTVNDEVEDFL